PARAINVPFEMTYDRWGSRILYAVTEELARSPGQYINYEGGIHVIDEADRSVITPEGSAAYVVLSHGPDRVGGVSVSGGQVGTECNNTQAMDFENCNYRQSAQE